ncbi:MAG: RNA-binding S4 domain-containing protein [Caulobacterales bacterium]|nr:RNA-binding S4 domain-containing protein [Caulobacterales bacterium]
MTDESAAAPDRVRLDVWLWRARFFKTRTLASAFVAQGRVRLARGPQVFRVTKAHQEVMAGDRLTFARAGRIVDVELRDIGRRRGPAAEARALYQPVADEPAAPGDEDQAPC